MRPLRAAVMCLPYSYKARHQHAVIYRAPACISRKHTRGDMNGYGCAARGLLHLVYLMVLSVAEQTEVHAGINHQDEVSVQKLGVHTQTHTLSQT